MRNIFTKASKKRKRISKEDKAMLESALIRPSMLKLIEGVTKEAAEVWDADLKKAGQGLDFTDPEDRAIFRGKLTRRTKQTRVSALKELALHYGAKKVPNSRAGAVRSLANAFMGYKY
jgi:hypothetical protein